MFSNITYPYFFFCCFLTFVCYLGKSEIYLYSYLLLFFQMLTWSVLWFKPQKVKVMGRALQNETAKYKTMKSLIMVLPN